MGNVQTVLGVIDSSELGLVVPHEHLLSLVPGAWITGGKDNRSVEIAVNALSELKIYGVKTVCDLSPYGVVGRDEYGDNAALLKDISIQTGLHIISGTGTYLEAFSPSWISSASEDELTERFIKDAQSGIGSSGIKAGILGEQATGLDVVTPYERKGLRASARASVETGLGIMTHCTHATMAEEQIKIIREVGVSLSRVVLGHIDTQVDVIDMDYTFRLLDTGVNIGVDTIGKQVWQFFLSPPPDDQDDGRFTRNFMYRSDTNRASMVAEMCSRGYAEQVFLSMDITGAEIYMNTTTTGQSGYSYMLQVFIPMLKELGVTSEQIEHMTEKNPARMLSIM